MANGNSGTALVQRDAESVPALSAFDGNQEAMNAVVRMANGLAASTLVPIAYQNHVSNVIVALEYAHRLGASVLAVMQNLDVIHGRPSLRASFLMGTVNASGRFSPIRFRWQGTPGTDEWGCRAWATDRQSGEECLGPLITVELAKKEGWWSKKDKNGRETSKWQTIPELMLMYRAGGWWTRVYCPELSLGLHTTDELEDMAGAVPPRARAQLVSQALDAPDEPEGKELPQPSTAIAEPPASPELEQQKDLAMRAALDVALEKHRPALLNDPEALHDFLLNATGNGDVDSLDRADMRAAISALEKPAPEKPKAAAKPAAQPSGANLFED